MFAINKLFTLMQVFKINDTIKVKTMIIAIKFT